MKKTIAIIATAATLMIASAPSQAAGMTALKALGDGAGTADTLVQKTGRRGRIAAGIALGIAGAAIAHHAYRHHHYRPSRWERRCRRWARRCDWGSDRACYKYETRC
ncbi:MAG: hypothetical protein AAGD43_33260 [Pseudomonadota bacterium]